MANKRSTAERRKAAKIGWQMRRLKAAKTPTKSSDKLPSAWDAGEKAIDYNEARTLIAAGANAQAEHFPVDTTTIGATKEGHEFFVTITYGGSLFRHRVSGGALRKLGLDCLQLVG